MTVAARLASTVPAFVGTGGLALGAAAVLWGATPAGNTALAVPFVGGPALLAGGWVALALALRHQIVNRGRLLGGALAALGLGFLLALLTVFAPVFVTGPAGTSTSVAALAVALAAPVLAVPAGVLLAAWLSGSSSRRGLVAGAAVALLGLGATRLPGCLGYFVIPLVIPLVLVTPLMVGHGTVGAGWVVPMVAGVATVVALVLGLVLGGQLTALLLVAGPGVA